MSLPVELSLPKNCPQDLYFRIKNYVGDVWDEEKHFFYIDNLRINSPTILVFEEWNYPNLNPPSYKDLNLPSPNLKISSSALTELID